jgi:hypothetical protein
VWRLGMCVWGLDRRVRRQGLGVARLDSPVRGLESDVPGLGTGVGRLDICVRRLDVRVSTLERRGRRLGMVFGWSGDRRARAGVARGMDRKWVRVDGGDQ